MSQPLVNVTIDGRTVSVPKGTNLMEAAKQVGVIIPHFCYHPKLEPAGVCRMCLVQIEKIPKPQSACTTYCADGMVVMTQNTSPIAADLQKGVLEFLLVNHPLDCPVCDKGGECDLQDLTFAHGPGASRLQDPKIRRPKSVELGNFIVLDNERCILCRRCTRFDDEIATEGNLIVEERGHYNTITTMEGQRYDSYFSGNTIELCPVGALTSDIYRFKARPWDLAKADSVCTGCSVGCNVHEEFRHGELLRLTSRENPEVDGGWLCDRGRFNYKFVHADERVTRPLVKRNGKFEPVTWSEAMSVVANKLSAIKAEAGAGALGVIGGGKLTNEEAYLLQKFARTTLGTQNVDHRVNGQTVVSLGAFAGRQTDLSDADLIVVIDTDPGETAPVLDLRIRKAASKRTAKIAVIGPVQPRQYRGRHIRIQTRPGQTAAVLRTLAGAGAEPQSDAAKLASQLAAAKKVAAVWNGVDPQVGKALVELGTSLKKSEVSLHVFIPGAQHNSRGAEAMGMLPKGGGLSTGGMLRAAAEGRVQALLLAGANLLNTHPDRKLAEAALANSYVVAIDLFLNETVQMADVVLPATTLTEKTGTYTALDGLVQPVRAAKRAPGVAQHPGDILVGLSAAMGVKLAESPADTAAEVAKLGAKAGAVLAGVNATALGNGDAGAQAGAPAAEHSSGLMLVPVDRLYAGGSTVLFDEEFHHAYPKPEAFFSPADATRMGLTRGEEVELAANGFALRLSVRIDRSVAAGTVQAIKGLPGAPANLLTAGIAPVVVSVAKLAVEVAD